MVVKMDRQRGREGMNEGERVGETEGDWGERRRNGGKGGGRRER